MNRDPSIVIRALQRHKDLMVKCDLRVGQFIHNAMERAGAGYDTFYIENDKLVAALDDYAAFISQGLR